MAYGTIPRTTTIYKDFEPAYEWSEDQNLETLLIYLPDFNKEDVRVQIDNYGNLRVQGERRLERNQRLRFSKDFEMPDNCNVDEIKANFRDGLLYIWLPKLITKAEPEEQMPKTTPKPDEQKPEQQKPKITQRQDKQMPNNQKETDEKQSTGVKEELEKGEPKRDHERDDYKMKEELSLPGSKMKKEREVGNGMKENGSLAMDKSQQRKLLINVVVSLMVLVGLGMYATFKMSKS